MKNLLITAFLFLISSACFSQRIRTFKDCPQREVYLQFETPPTTAKHAGIMQAYLDSSFYKAHPAPDGVVWLFIQVDTLGSPCCLAILERAYCSMEFDTIRSIINKMPALDVATLDGEKIVSCLAIELKFKLKHVELEQAGVNLAPLVPNVFINGIIVNTNNDTLVCRVPLSNFYRKPFYIKRTLKGQPEKYPIDSIQFLANGFQAFENISYTDSAGIVKRRLMELKAEGAINLYIDPRADLVMSDTRSIVTDSIFGQRRPAVHILRKDGLYYPVSAGNFVRTIRPLLSEFPELVNALDSGKYDFKSIDKLVTDFNERYDKRHSLFSN